LSALVRMDTNSCRRWSVWKLTVVGVSPYGTQCVGVSPYGLSASVPLDKSCRR
jgi:hypothetical protein